MSNGYNNDFFCEICQIQTNSPESYEQHISGKNHKKREKRIKEEDKNWYCEECDVVLNSKVSYDQHLKGKNHRKNVRKKRIIKELNKAKSEPLKRQEFQYSRKIHSEPIHKSNEEFFKSKFGLLSLVKEKKKKRFYCEICKVECSSEENYRVHLKGKNHLKMKAKSEGTFRCEICNIICSNETNYLLHINGRNHKRKVMMLEDKEYQKGKKLTMDLNCDICGKEFPSMELFENHINSEFHRRKKREIERRRQSNSFFPPTKCEFCNLNFYTRKNYLDHIEGKKHKRMMEKHKLESNNKFIHNLSSHSHSKENVLIHKKEQKDNMLFVYMQQKIDKIEKENNELKKIIKEKDIRIEDLERDKRRKDLKIQNLETIVKMLRNQPTNIF